jgi:hypothetical protein
MSSNKMPLMNELKLGVSPTVVLCTVGGGALGLILAMWAVSDNVGIIASVTFVFAVMSGLFSMFI